MTTDCNLMSSIHVCILKAPSEEPEKQDTYVQSLENVKISATFIPTLQFRFKNLDSLLQRLNNPENYAGIIFTSPRCVRSAIESLQNSQFDDKWKHLKCFVVGEATGKLVKNELNLNYEGESSGNFANLLQEISKYNFQKPLLMPVSSLHKDTATDVKLEKIEVYETCEHEQLQILLKEAFKTEVTNVIVFFSPSGVKSALPYISSSTIERFQFVAIGPTTAEEMKMKNLQVHGICKKPNPESLIEVIFSLLNVKQ